MKAIGYLVLAGALLALGACLHHYDDAVGYNVEKYPYVRGGKLADIYAPGVAPQALESCTQLLDNLKKPENKQISARSTREVQVRVLSFSEVYDSQRIHAALTDTLDFNTLIPGKNGAPDRRVFVRVPKGFVTDFTSIPPGFAQSFHRSFGRTAIPAIVHDFLYAIGEPGNAEERKLADTVLRRGMLDNGSRFISRRSVYIIVRMGGAGSYGAFRELRFLDPTREVTPRYHDPNTVDTLRLVVPAGEFRSDAEGRRISGAEGLRKQYVQVCTVS